VVYRRWWQAFFWFMHRGNYFAGVHLHVYLIDRYLIPIISLVGIGFGVDYGIYASIAVCDSAPKEAVGGCDHHCVARTEPAVLATFSVIVGGLARGYFPGCCSITR